MFSQSNPKKIDPSSDEYERVDSFPIDNENNLELLKKCLPSGFTKDNIKGLDLKTEGTSLYVLKDSWGGHGFVQALRELKRADLDISQRAWVAKGAPDKSCYYLCNEDTILAITFKKTAPHDSRTETWIKTEKFASLWPSIQSTIYFPLGERPISLDGEMKHLAYLGIDHNQLLCVSDRFSSKLEMTHLANIGIDHDHPLCRKGLWFLKLPGDSSFIYPPSNGEDHFLFYKGEKIICTRAKWENGKLDKIYPLRVYLDVIAAHCDMQNLLNLPSLEYNYNSNRNCFDCGCFATIEAGCKLIESNRYKRLSFDPPTVGNEFNHYAFWDEEKAQLLFSALKKNSTLEELSLSAGYEISFTVPNNLNLMKPHTYKYNALFLDDLLGILDAVKDISSLKVLSIESDIVITRDDIPKVLVAVEKLKHLKLTVKHGYPLKEGHLKEMCEPLADVIRIRKKIGLLQKEALKEKEAKEAKASCIAPCGP